VLDALCHESTQWPEYKLCLLPSTALGMVMSLQLLWITQATTKKVEFESFQLACLSLFIYINLW
jgi:hypothetical protein